MKIFLRSGSSDDLSFAADAGLLDGIALSVADLLPDPDSMRERILELTQEFPVPILVPLTKILNDDVYRDARELARISDFVVVQVPFIDDTLHPIRRLITDGVKVCTTYVYSGAQAFIAGKIGATMTMIQVDDLDAHGRQSAQLIAEIRDVFDHGGLECDLVVSGPQSSAHFTECILAGADTICATRDVLERLTAHSLTDRGIDRLLASISKLHTPRSV